jgi:hypothetical protein
VLAGGQSVSAKMLDGRVVRANEGRCSERKGRSAPEREATNTPALQAGEVRCDVLMATLLAAKRWWCFPGVVGGGGGGEWGRDGQI